MCLNAPSSSRPCFPGTLQPTDRERMHAKTPDQNRGDSRPACRPKTQPLPWPVTQQGRPRPAKHGKPPIQAASLRVPCYPKRTRTNDPSNGPRAHVPTRSHAEMSTSFARISMHGTEYSFSLSGPCRRLPQSLRQNSTNCLIPSPASSSRLTVHVRMASARSASSPRRVVSAAARLAALARDPRSDSGSNGTYGTQFGFLTLSAGHSRQVGRWSL